MAQRVLLLKSEHGTFTGKKEREKKKTKLLLDRILSVLIFVPEIFIMFLALGGTFLYGVSQDVWLNTEYYIVILILI